MPGDVVLISSGDVVPADIRLSRCGALLLDRSVLTGESVPEPASVEADPPEAVEQVGDVAPEDAPEGVELVDDDVAQAHEERGPAVVVGEDPDVEHLGVGQHHVGRPPEGCPLLHRRVAVVGHCPHPRHEPRPQGPQLVVGQRLGRVEVEGPGLRVGEDALEGREVEAEALAAGRAGRDDRVLAVPDRRVIGDERVCERCGTPVIKKNLEQWFLKITAYAEELLRGLDDLDWQDSAKRAMLPSLITTRRSS